MENNREKNKMTKDIVPTDFTIGLALMDFLPVIFFGLFGIILGMIFNKNPIIVLGAAITVVSGLIKVIWKIIVVIKKKNIWWMFVQMRIVMPLSMLLMMAGIGYSFTKTGMTKIITAITGLPQIIFFVIGIVGIVGMIYSAKKLDSSDAKSNLIEQTINSVAQLSFLIGVLFILL